MKDLIIDDISLKLGNEQSFTYRIEIEDVYKLNLRKYQCQMPVNDYQAKLHRQGLHVQCLANCKDEIENRIPCNCTELNAFNRSIGLPDCEHMFKDYLEMGNVR